MVAEVSTDQIEFEQRSTDGFVQWFARVPLQLGIQLVELDLPQGVHRLGGVELIDPDGKVVVSGYSLQDAQEVYRRQQRELSLEKLLEDYREQQQDLVARCQELHAQGLPTTLLEDILYDLDRKLYGLTVWRLRQSGWSQIEGLLNDARREIERLSGDPVEVILDELISGRLPVEAQAHNQRILNWLEGLSIRSGGAIGPDPELLRLFFEERLQGATTVTQARRCDLALDQREFLPSQEYLNTLELAPESIELPTGKRGAIQSYNLMYRYIGEGDERRAVAVVCVTLTTYNRLSVADYPKLPHDIAYVVEVERDGELIYRGFLDDPQLGRRVQKAVKGARGSANVPKFEEFAGVQLRRRGPIVADPPPPWHRGARLR